MTKAIKVCLSDSEYRQVEALINSGNGRTKADFARTAIILYIKNFEKDQSQE